MFHSKELTQLALDLTTGISDQRRFERLLATVRNLFRCDASTLLVFREQKFVPLAMDGLADDVMGRHFEIEQHPRLEAIARAGDVVRFPADSQLPDPFDGLIESHEDQLHVHACVGLPLIVHERLVGALTIDGFDPHQFDAFSDDELRTVSALAAASLHNALLLEQLERLASSSPGELETLESHVQSQVEMIGTSKPMLQLKQEIEVVAETDMTTLILGETGVGKELVAAAIHQRSSRFQHPMVYLNCAALPETVAESELFGHVKGAFTGAISHRKGKFELADNGTLFLDEVGELSLTLQSKLLRVLQYGDLQRVGDDSSLKVNTRILAATNRDLNEEVKAGRFRADLYHRLSVFPVKVPPLRDRGNDTLLLAGHFIEQCRSKFGLQHLGLSPASQKALLSYQWPGNVRELEHSIHRATILAKAAARDKYIVLEPEHFGLQQRGQEENRPPSDMALQATLQETLQETLRPATGDLRVATEDFQRQMIQLALDESNGRWSAAARRLSLDAGNLHRLARRLGLK